MSTLDLIKDTHQGKLTRLDAFNKSFEFTNGLPKRIEILISEIDDFIKPKKQSLFKAYDYFLDIHFDLEPFFISFHDLENLGFEFDDLQRIENESKSYCYDFGIGERFSLKTETVVDFYYPDFTKRLEQLKSDLHDFIDNPTESNPKEPPTAKDVWGLVARYNFLDGLGILSVLKNLSETEKAKAISQILGCNLHNAKKLKNGTYPTNETKDEQIERTQLINLIKQT
jgi:hypothetical protein